MVTTIYLTPGLRVISVEEASKSTALVFRVEDDHGHVDGVGLLAPEVSDLYCAIRDWLAKQNKLEAEE